MVGKKTNSDRSYDATRLCFPCIFFINKRTNEQTNVMGGGYRRPRTFAIEQKKK